jgi:hypothetical protein
MNLTVMPILTEGTKRPWTWASSKFVADFINYDEKTLKPMFIRKQKEVVKDDHYKPSPHSASPEGAE